MSTKPSSPELRPNRYDALVVLVAGFYRAARQTVFSPPAHRRAVR